MAAYRATIQVDPGYAEAHANLGAILCDVQEDVDGAEEAFRAALTCNPELPEALHSMGMVYSRRAAQSNKEGDLCGEADCLDQAVDYCARSIAAGDDSEQAEWFLGLWKDKAARIRAGLAGVSYTSSWPSLEEFRRKRAERREAEAEAEAVEGTSV